MKPFAWILSKVDKKQRLPKWRASLVAAINKRPVLKTLVKLAFISYTIVNIVTQLISFPAFSAGVGRKNTSLRNDYAAAAACVEKTKLMQPCSVAETASLKKAWDNDILICYGNGNLCLAERTANPIKAPPAPKR